MKQFFLSIALTCSAISFGQKPETVYSIAMEVRAESWYQQQMQLWKAETDKDKHNGTAWTNYYMAARALRNISEDPEKHESYRKKCDEIVAELHQSYPDSFEDYYLTYANNGDPGKTELLMKAAAINPHDERILDEMLIQKTINFDQAGFDSYSSEMFKQNQMPAALLNWGHNILSELDENAILFTCGDNDTYAAWINQGAFGFRKDVTVINTSLILIDDYRDKLFKKLGLPSFNRKFEGSDYNAFSNLIYQHIVAGKMWPVYVSNTAVTVFPEAFQSNLYLTGLSHRYSQTPLETGDLIVRNYESRYLTDYLKQSFSWHFADEKSKEFNSMYLPSMIKLYHHYAQTEEETKRQKTGQLLLKIAEESGRKTEVLELMKPENNSTPAPKSGK